MDSEVGRDDSGGQSTQDDDRSGAACLTMPVQRQAFKTADIGRFILKRAKTLESLWGGGFLVTILLASRGTSDDRQRIKTQQISQLRSFSRLVSRTIGALQERYLGRDRPLAEARLIFEIGKGGAEIKGLRRRLGLDSGYLSRLLRSLERQGLVTNPSVSQDRRVRRTELTMGGIGELRELNRRSNSGAKAILDPLNEQQRTRLNQAMIEVERLLAVSVASIDEESALSRDAKYCLREYYRELSRRFEKGFNPARSLSPTPKEFRSPNGAFFIVRLDGKAIGCGAFKRMPKDAAYLKRMWIAADYRGLGLGKKLLMALEDRAKSAGFRRTLLETNKSLVEAQLLYRGCGYREVKAFNAEPYAHHWFEKSLT